MLQKLRWVSNYATLSPSEKQFCSWRPQTLPPFKNHCAFLGAPWDFPALCQSWLGSNFAAI